MAVGAVSIDRTYKGRDDGANPGPGEVSWSVPFDGKLEFHKLDADGIDNASLLAALLAGDEIEREAQVFPITGPAILSGSRYTFPTSSTVAPLSIGLALVTFRRPGDGAGWVTADQVLLQSGAYRDPATATPADREWAEVCAAAVNAGFARRLEGALIPDYGQDELRWAARLAGVETYKRREATFGITGYVDLQGAAIRIARDYLESVAPIVARWATVGIS